MWSLFYIRKEEEMKKFTSQAWTSREPRQSQRRQEPETCRLEKSLTPGFSSEMTPTLNNAGIVSGNLIRWKRGLVEKLGGWIRFYPFSVGSIPRELHAWQDLSNNDYLAV